MVNVIIGILMILSFIGMIYYCVRGHNLMIGFFFMSTLVGRFSQTGGLGQGLSTAILMFCIGTLSILGPINSALYGDDTYLFTNATLDFVTSMTLASTYGIGIACAAGVLFCWQGAIYLSAGALSGFLTPELMTEVSVLGGILLAASGLSMLQIRDCKTLNLLPALVVPVIWFGVRALF